MAYTKGELIEQVYLKVTGGQPSQDVNVKRFDIIPFVSAAIQWVLTKEIRQRRREEAQLGEYSSDVEDTFLGTFFFDVQTDEERCLQYIVLENRLQSLPGNGGLKYVSAPNSDYPFQKLLSQWEDVTVGKILSTSNITRYWYEKVETEERVYFKNLASIVDKVMVRMVTSLDTLGEDDLVPLPGGLEIEVLDMAVRFFAEQRNMPDDMINDNNDNKDNQ